MLCLMSCNKKWVYEDPAQRIKKIYAPSSKAGKSGYTWPR